jgi:putative pyruvate formate lyase activating enzyme
MKKSGVDLTKEPMSIAVMHDPRKGRTIFSDIPQQLLKPLAKAYGTESVLRAIVPGEIERDYYLALDESDRVSPRYVEALHSGELDKRVEQIDRQGDLPETIPYFMTAINRSDEAIFGKTGAIYFVCKKGCHFCQYRDFSERRLTVDELADRMLALQEAGADNVHWVSPSAYTRFLVKALHRAASNGLTLPIIHKSEGEDSMRDLALLDGLVDVYLPDVKFATVEFAPNIGLPPSYVERMKPCIREMYRQVGPLKRRKELPKTGIPLEGGGLFVRHLIMPSGVAEARAVFEFLMTVDDHVPVHLTVNYQPYHAALQHPVIGRHVTASEVEGVISAANEVGLRAVFCG